MLRSLAYPSTEALVITDSNTDWIECTKTGNAARNKHGYMFGVSDISDAAHWTQTADSSYVWGTLNTAGWL